MTTQLQLIIITIIIIIIINMANADGVVSGLGFGRKRLWPNLRHYSSMCLEKLEKTMVHLKK